jgi:hypothetical protein
MNARQFANVLLSDNNTPKGAESSLNERQKIVDFCYEKILSSVNEQQRSILERSAAVVLFENVTDAYAKAVPDSPDEVVFIVSFRLMLFLRWILNSGVWFATKSSLDNQEALAELCHALCQMFAFSFTKRPLGNMPEFMREPLDWQQMVVGSVSSTAFTLGHEMGHVLQAHGDRELTLVRGRLNQAKLAVTSEKQMDELVCDYFGTRCVLHVAGTDRGGLLWASGPFVALAYTSAIRTLLAYCELLVPATTGPKKGAADELLRGFEELSDYPMANLRREALLSSFGSAFTQRETQFGELLARMVASALEYMDDKESIEILALCMNMLTANNLRTPDEQPR